MITMKAYKDVNGEVVYVEDGSFQDLDSIAASLIRVPGLDFIISADLLSNLTLDAKLDDSQLIDDDTFVTAANDNIPSAESVKAYVDSQVSSKDEADEITYDNTASGLTATNVQTAIDEVEGRVDVTETDITELETNQDDIISLTGVAENSTDLGTFAGTIITDNATIKSALQQLETAQNNTRVTDVFVVATIAARDALATQDEGDVAVVLDDGTGRRHSYIWDGAAWQDLKTGDTVTSVNTQTGDVVLDTDDVNEGTSNLYFTVARARAAAVVNSTAGVETDQAASVAAMKAYVAAQIETKDEADEISYDNATSGLTATDVQAAIDELKSSLSKEYFYANQTVAQTGIQNTPVSVVFDNEAKNSDAAVFSVNTTTGEITVNKDGDYKINYSVTADTQDGARRTSETIIEIDTGSGFAAVSAALASSTAYGYHRNNASGENTAAAIGIISLTSGDSIRLRIRRSNGSGTIRTVPVGTSITIEEK